MSDEETYFDSDGISPEDFLELLRDAVSSGDDSGDDPRGGSRAAVRDDDAFNFATVAEAEELIDRYLSGGGGNGGELRRVADWLLVHGEGLSETANDWHDLIMHFIRCNDYRYVYKLAMRALERFPFDASLLGDAVQATGKGGFWKEGEQVIAQAQRLPKRYWNWYLCCWICEFYLSLATASDPEQRSAIIAKGVEVAEDCRRQFPLEERIYNQEAELLIADCRIDDARRVLEDAIYNPHRANDGTEHGILCPQCCITYLESILEGTNDYDRIIDIARRGTKNAASKESSTKVGYFVFREALALDGMIHEEEERSHARGFGNQDLVRQALETYKLAYELRKREGMTMNCRTIRERFDILCGKSGITDLSLGCDED